MIICGVVDDVLIKCFNHSYINNRIQTWDNTLPWVSPSIDDEIIDDSDISEEDDKNDGLLADITDNVDFINNYRVFFNCLKGKI